jgi:hypothetical protein
MSRRPARWIFEDALSSTTRALEALADGDVVLAEQILAGLAHDLENELLRESPATCRFCERVFRWPGERDHHEHIAHGHRLKRSRAA